MPYPSQVTRETLIETAWEMIATEGSAESVSLAKLAAAFGVKAPSLYRYVKNKTELLQAVNLVTNERLVDHMHQALNAADTNPQQRALTLCTAYREFALAHPVLYQLAFATNASLQPDPASLEQLALPLQTVISEISGDESLLALRGGWALVHGFIMLEINGLFRREGDLDAAFFRALQAYIDGWSRRLST